MPIHDWTLVDAGIFHAFHTLWITHINEALNEGLLPSGYYALPEQHAGESIADILTLHGIARQQLPTSSLPESGGIAVADAPPRARHRQTFDGTLQQRRRTLAVRHVSGHRLIAMLEIVSPGNKDRVRSVSAFKDKAVAALLASINLLIVDLFPPGPNDPQGIHGEIIKDLSDSPEPYELPSNEPLTLAAYSAGPPVESFTEHLNAGQPLPEMPLFLNPDRYVNVPLETTYEAAYRGMPAFWRGVLEGKSGQ